MQISLTSSRRTGRGPVDDRASRAIVGTMFAIVGAGMIWLFSDFWAGWWSARSWQPAQCEILKSYVAVNRSDGTPAYRVIATYRYGVGSKVFVGLRYRLDDAFSPGRDEKDEIVRAMPPGSRVPCWVNAAEPSEAVIDRTLGMPGFVLFILPAGFIGIGIGSVYRAIGRRGRSIVPVDN